MNTKKPTKTPMVLFQESCKITGDDPKDLPYANPSNYRQHRANAFHMLGIIEDAKNSDDPIKFRDGKFKYSPFFNVKEDESKPSGFGLSFTYTHCAISYARIGSRLVYMNSPEKAEEIFNECLPLFETIILRNF